MAYTAYMAYTDYRVAVDFRGMAGEILGEIL
jgi:hypothetical protein